MNSVDTNVDVKMEDVKVEVINQILKDEAKNNDIKSIYKEETTSNMKRKYSDDPDLRRSKREKRRPNKRRYDSAPPSQAEEKAIAQALENSKRLQKLDSSIIVPDAPVFHPTLKEFENPIAYISKIRDEFGADRCGICKIVPPKEWDPPSAKLHSFTPPFNSEKRFLTKKQYLHRLEEGIYFPEGKKYTVKEYEIMANEFTRKHLKEMKIAGRLNGGNDGIVKKEEEKRNTNSHSSGSSANNNDMSNNNNDNCSSSSNSSSSSNDANDDNNITATPEELIKEYWRIVEKCEDKVSVEYGNDLDVIDYGSGFPVRKDLHDIRLSYQQSIPSSKQARFEENVPLVNDGDYYENCGWNLNNLPHWPGSLLRNISGNYNGINVPWLYMGMLFSTFAWHNEDNYLYSINYHHYGAPKVWYGVPGKDASKFEQCIEKMKAQRVREEKDVLQKLVLMTGPATLTAANVPLVKCVQNPGEYIVTFPKAFHGGFSLGFNCGEAVNFALPDWIPFGRDASETYRKSQRAPSISNERLLMQVARNPTDLKDVESCEILIKDLQRTMNDQKYLRSDLARNGVTTDVPMPADEDSESYDEKRQCHICMHMCYVSALVCSCDSERVVCLRHWQHLCNCGPEEKCHLYWFSLHDIEDLIIKVRIHKNKLERLKMS